MGVVPGQAGLEVQHVQINATADGNNTVIAAVSGKKIRVLAYVITATVAGAVRFDDTAAAVYARFSLPANGGVSFAGSDRGPAFETAVGTGVVVNTTATQDVLGHITYQEV